MLPRIPVKYRCQNLGFYSSGLALYCPLKDKLAGVQSCGKYSDNLSEETKKGWSERRKQGLYCGLLPFGAMKGDDGVPIPHTDNYPRLAKSFELSAIGKSGKEVAQAFNLAGYRTTGNRGPQPFSRDTVRGMLTNKFYLGHITDGNGGWIKAKHESFIDEEL